MPDLADHDPDFDALIDRAARRWRDEQGDRLSDHPDIETLIAYQEGTLPEAEADTLRGHLVACAECRDDLLALEHFDQDAALPVHGEAHAAPPTAEEMASWRDFEAARDLLRHVIPLPEPVPIGRPWHAAPWVLAASLLLALVGVGSWLLPGRGGGDTPLVVDLVPDGASTVRSVDPQPEFPVTPGFDTLTPRLHLGDAADWPAFAIEMTTAEGARVKTIDRAVHDRTGRVAFSVPIGRVPPGSYRIRLYGLRDGQRTELAVYSFRLRDGG